MSEQLQPFTVEDVQDAYFAYGIDQCLEVGETPEYYIRRSWPELPPGTYEGMGIPPQLPILLARSQRGAEILTWARVVSSRRIVGRGIEARDYEGLGKVDSEIWMDDGGSTIYRHLRALRLLE
jgi:hypothetical protein